MRVHARIDQSDARIIVPGLLLSIRPLELGPRLDEL